MVKLIWISITTLAFVYICESSEAQNSLFLSIPTIEWKPEFNESESVELNNKTVQDQRAICTPPLLIHGTVDPIKPEFKSKDVIQILCNDGYELENIQSSLLYCSLDGLWKVFTLGDSTFIPLPRCIAKRRCPQPPPLLQGSLHSQGNRVVYKCWTGLELEPAESETRYCLNGKWTGENPQCVRSGCGRPPTIPRGFFTSRGMINHIYMSGSSVQYHCDSGFQLYGGPSSLTCSNDKEWIPKEFPSCEPVEPNVSVQGCPLPPSIAKGEFQILPWRPGSNNATTVPVYSSAVYMCHRGYILHGSSLISCSPHGWWQPFTVPRCIPEAGYSGDASDTEAEQGSLPWLVSLTTGFGVIFGLSLIWIASRIQINCRKTRQAGVPTVCHAVNGASAGSASTPSSSASVRRSLWDWVAIRSPNGLRGSGGAGGLHRSGGVMGDQENNDSMTTMVSTDPDQDRVALIAYMSDSQQANLPTYEEAVRATWPLAPPPYESILVEGLETDSITSSQSPSALVLLESDDAAADANSSIDFDTPSLNGGMDFSDLNSSCEALVPSSAVV